MPEGGTTTGAGVYYYGNYCTLTATPNEGYLFLNWSKNGEVVSCNATYSFAVTEEAEIEAVFMPLEGTLIGRGESTNQYLPSYSFYNYTLSQQIYTPNELGGAGTITSIAYYNGGTTQTRSYNIYMVHADKSAFDNNTDWITVSEADRVYSGSVNMTRGYWTTIELDTPFAYDGSSNLAIIVDDNTGTYSNSMACRVFNASGYQAIRVYSDGTNYDPYNPSEYSGTRQTVKNQMILGITPLTVQQTIELTAGWNWVSTYIEGDAVELLQAIEESLRENVVSIEGIDGMTENLGEGFWMGALEDIGVNNAGMYQILVNEPCTLVIPGTPVDPAEVVINIEPGWNNWIGFPVSEEMDLADALSGFAEEGDMIEGNIDGLSEYLGDDYWMGFTTLTPGQGYYYYSASNESRILTFSIDAKASLVSAKKLFNKQKINIISVDGARK